MRTGNHQSEVTHLMAQIAQEYNGAKRGLGGLAVVASHESITARMENIGRLHAHLQVLVGDNATRLLREALERAE